MAKPKKSCCISKPRCNRCPVRMLAEGRLPEGYAVRKLKLVKLAKVAGKKHGKGNGKQKRPKAA